MNTPDARDSTSIPDWTNVAVERIADGIDRQMVWSERRFAKTSCRGRTPGRADNVREETAICRLNRAAYKEFVAAYK